MSTRREVLALLVASADIAMLNSFRSAISAFQWRVVFVVLPQGVEK